MESRKRFLVAICLLLIPFDIHVTGSLMNQTMLFCEDNLCLNGDCIELDLTRLNATNSSSSDDVLMAYKCDCKLGWSGSNCDQCAEDNCPPCERCSRKEQVIYLHSLLLLSYSIDYWNLFCR